MQQYIPTHGYRYFNPEIQLPYTCIQILLNLRYSTLFMDTDTSNPKIELPSHINIDTYNPKEKLSTHGYRNF